MSASDVVSNEELRGGDGGIAGESVVEYILKVELDGELDVEVIVDVEDMVMVDGDEERETLELGGSRMPVTVWAGCRTCRS